MFFRESTDRAWVLAQCYQNGNEGTVYLNAEGGVMGCYLLRLQSDRERCLHHKGPSRTPVPSPDLASWPGGLWQK
jgi:hypothetical protein